MTWEGSIYLEQCVEHPEYSIKTEYSYLGQHCVIRHKGKPIGYASEIEDARAIAQAHLDSTK